MACQFWNSSHLKSTKIYNLPSKSSIMVNEGISIQYCVWRKGKNSDFFNLYSAAFTMIVFFTLVIAPQSLSCQCFNYGKTAFFLSELLDWNGSNTFQMKITTAKHGCFFCKNWQEQLMRQKIIMSSCNKPFRQVLSFLSNLTSTLFILRITLSSHLSEIRSKFLNY